MGKGGRAREYSSSDDGVLMKSMDVDQVAAYLGLSVTAVNTMASSGEIPVLEVKGVWRFKKDVIDVWLRAKGLQSLSGTPATAAPWREYETREGGISLLILER